MKQHALFSLFIGLLAFVSCNGQMSQGEEEKKPQVRPPHATVGGGCDGCEIMYVDMPKNIDVVDTSGGWYEKGQKPLLKGQVFKPDGKTPAPGVIVYYWQTDNHGYFTRPGISEQAKRHGHIRGWAKTDTEGRCWIFTVRPSAYPKTDNPAHIHTSVKEPDIENEYYVDEFVFNDDPFLIADKRKVHENRGCSGMLKTNMSGNLQVAEHRMILG